MKRFSTLFAFVKGLSNGGREAARKKPRTLLTLEGLEERCVPVTITEFPMLPSPNSGPMGMTVANDGSLWFTERTSNKIGRLTTSGVLTEYQVPTANSAPERITASPDGWIWFTERYGRKIGRISQAGGGIAEFALPGYGEYPTAITTRQDGTIWFASNQSPNVSRIGRITVTGMITHLPTAQTATYVNGLVGGPDGNLWATTVSSQWGDSVAKVSTVGSGSWTNYRNFTRYSSPQGITVGPDNNLWFTEKNAHKIGRITTSGVITEFYLGASRGPQMITQGPDGALWFTEQVGNKIGQITTAGVVTEYAVPRPSTQPFGIVAGLDGHVYFTEYANTYGNRLGKVDLSAGMAAAAAPAGLSFGASDAGAPAAAGELVASASLLGDEAPTVTQVDQGLADEASSESSLVEESVVSQEEEEVLAGSESDGGSASDFSSELDLESLDSLFAAVSL